MKPCENDTAPWGSIERFLSRVDTQPSQADGCWIWRGGRDTAGYGRWRDDRAHRASYRFFRGDIPDGLVVRHDCDQPACVRPSHLQLGTQADNVRDASVRGRRGTGDYAGAARYTEVQVAEARALRAQGMTYQQVSDAIGVPFSAVREWLQGRVRATVSRPPAPPIDAGPQYVERVMR